MRKFYVYIMTNGPKAAVLYIGATGSLTRRVWQHKNKLMPGFTGRYNLTRLVYYEQFLYPDAAIFREKEIKGWRREKKLKLVESMNPTSRMTSQKTGTVCIDLTEVRFKGDPSARWRKRGPSG